MINHLLYNDANIHTSIATISSTTIYIDISQQRHSNTSHERYLLIATVTGISLETDWTLLP